MSSLRQIFLAFLLFTVIITMGTSGYIFIESYPLIDAFYMTIITITTVGFGEIRPLSEAGRLFTSFLILTGFCGLAFVSHSVVESIVNSIWRKTSEIKKMQKKIANLKDHFVICGYGRVGEVATEHFQKAGVDFVVIESSTDMCETLKGKEYCFVEGDATSEEAMLDAGIKNARGLLALLGSDPANLFVVLSARELNPTLHIVARSEKTTSEHKILQAGADSVISPFTSAGQNIADSSLLATGHKSILSPSSTAQPIPQWIEVQTGSSMVGQTIKMLATDINRSIIGLRRANKDTIFPPAEETIQKGDTLLVIDPPEQNGHIESHQISENKKIVIIDDNPVIVRLYVRLFQKAGFYPLPAKNGEEGLALIVREKPVAAVIDYQLPLLSGVEVCKAVREDKTCDSHMQLILFTAHSDKTIHNKALKAGANAVIVKSQNASEIIESVVQHLKRPRNLS